VRTTALSLVFDAAEDITLTASGGNSGISKGRLDPGGSPLVYTLDVGEITEEGGVEAAVQRNGAPAAGSPKTAKARYGAQLAEFARLTASNTPYGTAALILDFGEPGIPDLETGDIYLNAGGANARKGTLNGGPAEYTFGVSGITAGGGVIAGINKAGYSTCPSLQRTTVSLGEFMATGGMRQLIDDAGTTYEVHTFDGVPPPPSDNESQVEGKLEFTRKPADGTVEVLVVAGGGGGGDGNTGIGNNGGPGGENHSRIAWSTSAEEGTFPKDEGVVDLGSGGRHFMVAGPGKPAAQVQAHSPR
jgi:hypothetical protein